MVHRLLSVVQNENVYHRTNKDMQNIKSRWLFIALISISLSACSKDGTLSAPTVSPTDSILPTATIAVEPFAILIAPDPIISSAGTLAAETIDTYALAQGWEVRRRSPGEEILGGDRPGTPRLVVSIQSGFGSTLYSAAQTNPEIRFVAVEESGIQSLPNLLVIGGENFRADQTAFMAGLLAGLEPRNDYVGWVGEDGTTRGKIFQNGFRHGIRYVCPRCRLFDFELSAAADAQAGIAAAEQLRADYIDTASAIPGAAGEAALINLANNGIRVAGAGTDFYQTVFNGGSAAGANNVLGEVAFRPDLILTEFLPRFLAGETFAQPIAYSLENSGLEYAQFPNPWISLARQTFLEKILSELASGRLDIGIDPLTGEER
jgi:basic membrane lipoprotein Med (substrate-binding protein (PBP1-ABC) superfamily)